MHSATPTRVREIRARLKMTQREFADAFDLPWPTVRDWEQGVSKPDRAALAYLKVIERDPDAVRNALASPTQGEGHLPAGRLSPIRIPVATASR